MAMNNPVQPELTAEQQQQIAVMNFLAKGVLERRDRFGNFTGGFKKMLNIYEVYDVAVKYAPEITVLQLTNILDTLIRLPEASPVKFFRRTLSGADWIWYGVSKKGWLLLQEAGYAVPEDAIEWANEPNKEPTPEQIQQNQSSGARLNEIMRRKNEYDEAQRAKAAESAKQQQDEVKEETSVAQETLPGLDADHPANTGVGAPKTGMPNFKDLFKK